MENLKDKLKSLHMAIKALRNNLLIKRDCLTTRRNASNC